jgi:HSP20 family molecular chaperone IbpA
MPKPMMDINAAPVIKPDGSLVGMWRDHHPSGKYSTPHLFTASNWSDPATYVLCPMRKRSEMIRLTIHIPGFELEQLQILF